MSRLKSPASVTAVVLLLAVMTLMYAERGEAQVGSTPVRVVNTPLPVTVTNPSGGGGGLGPTKASDLVTLRGSGAACTATSGPNVRRFDQRENGDGTETPFTIPAGEVLVVTSVDFRQGITGGSGQQEELFLLVASTTNSFSEMADLMAAPGSTDARAGLSAVITGAAIKSTGTPCWQVNSLRAGSADVILHGYLAPDL